MFQLNLKKHLHEEIHPMDPLHTENYGQLRRPQCDGKIWNIKQQHKSISTFHYLQEPSQLENPVKRKLKGYVSLGLGDPGKANKINKYQHGINRRTSNRYLIEEWKTPWLLPFSSSQEKLSTVSSCFPLRCPSC